MSTHKPIGKVVAMLFSSQQGGPRNFAKVKLFDGVAPLLINQDVYGSPEVIVDESIRQQAAAWAGIQNALRAAIPFYGEPVDGVGHVEATAARIVQFGANGNRAMHENTKHLRTIKSLRRRLSELKGHPETKTVTETTVRVGNMSETQRTTTFDVANAAPRAVVNVAFDQTKVNTGTVASHLAGDYEPTHVSANADGTFTTGGARRLWPKAPAGKFDANPVRTGTIGGASSDETFSTKFETPVKQYGIDAVSVAAEMESNPIIKAMLRQLVRTLRFLQVDE